MKTVFSVCSAEAVTEAEVPQAVSVDPQTPSWEPRSAPQHQAPELRTVSVTTVFYLYLFCASVSKIWPKVVTSLLYTVSTQKRFHMNTLLSDRWEICLKLFFLIGAASDSLSFSKSKPPPN